MDRFGCFFFITHFATNKQYHTTAQTTSKQLAQRNFHHVCSCMISVLFSNMLKDTHTADYVGQSFPEVGWYGKTCLFSLWILVVKSAVRIWIGLDGFFSLTHFATNTSSTTQPHKIKYQQTTCAIQFSPCLKSRTSKAPQSIKCDYCVVSFAVPYSYNSCVVFLQLEYADTI